MSLSLYPEIAKLILAIVVFCIMLYHAYIDRRAQKIADKFADDIRHNRNRHDKPTEP